MNLWLHSPFYGMISISDSAFCMNLDYFAVLAMGADLWNVCEFNDHSFDLDNFISRLKKK